MTITMSWPIRAALVRLIRSGVAEAAPCQSLTSVLPICFPWRFLGSDYDIKMCVARDLPNRNPYQLEMSCRSQVDAMAAGAELTMPGENVLAHTAHLYQPGTRRPYGVL